MLLRYTASLTLALCLLTPAAAQPLTIDLATLGGGTSADVGEGVAVAPDGSYYVAGTFEGTASFGELSLTSAGDSDAFLVKYDDDGDAVWARRSGTDVFWDYGRDVAVDAEGNVYYSGNFTGIATWDGGANPDIELTTRNDWDGFVAKYTSEGDLEWVQQLGGGGQDAANAVTVGPDGTVYAGGGFVGPGIFGDVTLPGAGSQDGFVAALSPADGDVIWAASAGGTDSDVIYGVGLDAAGDVYVAGQYRGVASVFGTPFQSNGLSDVFVAKLDADGEGVWAVAFGGAGNEYARGLGVSPAGHAVVTGSFEESVLVNQDILTSAGASDVLVAAVDPDGELAWGRQGGGAEFDFSEDAAVDAEGNVYVTGYVVGTGSFGNEPYAAAGFDDVFLATYDVAGELLHLDLAGGTNRDQGKGVALGNGRFAMTGSFRGTATFGDIELTGPGSNDVFLAAGEALGVAGPNPVIYVDADATGAEDGSSWPDAFTDLQDALALAATMDGERQIWVAEGIYTPTDDGDRTVSFELQSGLALYGGFDGTETELDQRDWEANETVLSGDIGTVGNTDDNSYHVVVATDIETSLLDGLTITKGYASSTAGENHRGAGMLLHNSNQTLRRITFLLNSAPQQEGGDFGIGGGLYAEGGDTLLDEARFVSNHALTGGGLAVIEGSIVIHKSLFYSNDVSTATPDYPGGGGGIYSEDSDIQLVDVHFSENLSRFLASGGALLAEGGSGILYNVSFENNVSSLVGGGATLRSGSFEFYNCVFAANEASPQTGENPGRGGAVWAGSAHIAFTNCTFSKNRTEISGGAVYSIQPTITFANSILWGNSPSEISTGEGTATVSRAIVEGGYPGTDVLDTPPLFVDTSSNDLRLQEGSPAIDFGLAEFLPPDTYDLDGDGDTEEPLPVDLDGDPRVQGNEVDLGAYESPFTVALEPGAGVPTTSGLAAAYPNPFRSATTLALDVAEAQRVTVEVFDVLGRRVATVHDGPLDVGEHRVEIEAGGLPAGVYVVRAEGETFRQAQRVTLVR